MRELVLQEDAEREMVKAALLYGYAAASGLPREAGMHTDLP